MNANMYCDILKQSMIPSLQRLGRRAAFQHDNDPKHTSKMTTALLKHVSRPKPYWAFVGNPQTEGGAKCHFFSVVTWKDIKKYIFTKMWGVYSLLWDTVYISLKCIIILTQGWKTKTKLVHFTWSFSSVQRSGIICLQVPFGFIFCILYMYFTESVAFKYMLGPLWEKSQRCHSLSLCDSTTRGQRSSTNVIMLPIVYIYSVKNTVCKPIKNAFLHWLQIKCGLILI